MAFPRRRREDPRLDLTPMVDVVFLLLIFFMISTTFVETPGITVELPEASTQVVSKEPEELKIYLSKEGELYHKERSLSMEALRELMAGYGKKAETTTFLLFADKEALHGMVVQIMDAAQLAGFGKMAIGTESPGGT